MARRAKPSIGKVIFRTVSDPETQIAELLTGSLNWIWDVPKDKAEELKATGLVQVLNVPTMRISYLQFNTLTSTEGTRFKSLPDTPFRHFKVRQGSGACDRSPGDRQGVGGRRVVCHPFGLLSEPAWLHPGMCRSMSTIRRRRAGCWLRPATPMASRRTSNAYRQREFTEAVMGFLAKVGIKTNLRYMQYKALRGIVWAGGSPFHQMTWGSYSMNDVSAITSHFFTHGRDDYCRDDVVKEQLQIGDTSTDPQVRKAAYKKALIRIQERNSAGYRCSPMPSITRSPTMWISPRRRMRFRVSSRRSGSELTGGTRCERAVPRRVKD